VFTGLIEEIGIVSGIAQASEGINLQIKCSRVTEQTKTGDSIAVNGACQTVTQLGTGTFTVFVSKVTAEITTLGILKKGDQVNLERAMQPASRFGGHFVLGHVDGMGEITGVKRDSNGLELEVKIRPEHRKYIVEKGSVTVDGISLTVVSLTKDGIILYLIPETLKNTIIGCWKIGSKVNIEVDILAKYVEKMLSFKEVDAQSENKSDDAELRKKLMEGGFI